MNDHTQIQDRLFAYLDFELEDAERVEVERHLAACSVCAQELEVTRRANEMFKAVEPQPLPDGFMARLQTRLDGPSDATVIPLNGAVRDNGVVRSSGVVPNVVLPFVPPPPSPLPKTELAPPPPEIRPSQARPQPRSGAMRWIGALAAVFVVAYGLLVLTRPLAPNPALAAAALAYSEGNIEMVRGGVTSTVTTTMALSPGDTLQTAVESKAVVTLGNNASVRLAENTRMHVLALETHANNGHLEAKIELQSGSIWVEEAGGVHCALQAGGSLIVPIGTTYQATLDGSSPLVQVWEGSVDVKSLTAGLNVPATSLIAGEQALLAPTGIDRAFIKQQVLKTNAFVSWNLRLQNLQHPRATTALTRPALMQSMQVPRFFTNPPHSAVPSAPVATQAAPVATPSAPVATQAASSANTGASDPPRAASREEGPAGEETHPGSAADGYPSAPIQPSTATPASSGARVTYQNASPASTSGTRVTYQNGAPHVTARPRVRPSASPHPHPTAASSPHPHHPHVAATLAVPSSGSYAPTVTVAHTPSSGTVPGQANRPTHQGQWNHHTYANPQGQANRPNPQGQWNRPNPGNRPNPQGQWNPHPQENGGPQPWNRPNAQWNRPSPTPANQQWHNVPRQNASSGQGPYTHATPGFGQRWGTATPGAASRRPNHHPSTN